MSDIAAISTLVCLHYLGGSGREFSALADALQPEWQLLPVDLTGFGDSHRLGGFGVSQMVDAVAAVVTQSDPGRWSMLGHSMGAKVATALTAQIERREKMLARPECLILVAGSPPSPEPMTDEKRSMMLQWFEGSETESRAQASDYLDQNVTRPLSPGFQASFSDDLLRMNRKAWSAWLKFGSREDWSKRVGILATPGLLIAGADDESLGELAQRQLMVPHFAASKLVIIPGATHLLPMETPGAVADAIRAFVRDPA